MATESPLMHDGAQTVSGFDARNGTITGTTRIGPNGSAQFLAVKLSSTTDRTVSLCTTSTERPYGILQNKPSTGIAADVGIDGVSKAVAGTTTITNGLPLMVGSSGVLIPFTTSSQGFCIGQAIEAPTAVGQVFTARIYGASGGPAF